MTCPLCAYNLQQTARLQEEVLRLRLEVADGPRARVRELEAHLAQANRTILELNARLNRKRKAG